MIETDALVAGFTSVGMDVLLLGPVPTPAVAMLTRSMRADPSRDDLGLAQPVRGQRHQAVRARRFKLNDAIEHEIEGLNRRRHAQAPVRLQRSRPGQAHRERACPLHRVRQADPAAAGDPGRVAGGGRLRQRRGLPGRPRDPVGARRRGHRHRHRAGRLQHQPGCRLDRARGADRQGARAPGRYRHRAGRRCRPGADRRREGACGRRRPAHGGRGALLAGGRAPHAAGCGGRDDHVESRPGALSRRPRSHPGPHGGGGPLRPRAHARPRLQSRGRAVRAHHHVGLHDHG